MSQVKVFGEHEQKVVDQLTRCLETDDAGVAGVLCADAHLGYSMPIGGVVAYPEHVSPSGVGYDIGCGNKAVLTDLTREDLDPSGPHFQTAVPNPRSRLSHIADEIERRISFGVGRRNDEPVEHPVLDRIRAAAFAPQHQLSDLAAKQLGTVGAGNHYVDLFADELERVWVGVHFGSRGFGHKTASGFLALAQGKRFDERAGEGEMEAPPTLLAVDSGLGEAYIEAMRLAGEYAYAGRDVVCAKVLEILGAKQLDEVHNHHNYAWREGVGGQMCWVVRKGATPAFPGQRGFVGSTMGEQSVILEGVEHPSASEALYSTVHGAGRAMSRNKAAGKKGKVYQCSERDCDFWVRRHEYAAERTRRGLSEHERFTMCADHPQGRMSKRQVRVTEGAIDWDAARAELTEKGVVLRGGAADEAPGAYKRLPEVLAHHEGTVRVLHTLEPLVVVMAGEDTYDPYKD